MQQWELRATVDARGAVIFDRLWGWDNDDPTATYTTAWAASAASGGIRPLTLREGEIPQTRSSAWLGTADAPYVLADVAAFSWNAADYLLMSSGTTGALTLMRNIGSGRLETEWTLQGGDNRPLSMTHLLVIEQDDHLLLIGNATAAPAALQLYDWQADLRHAGLRSQIEDTEKATLSGLSDLLHIRIGTQDFVISSSSAEDGLSSFSVTPDGLTLQDTLGPKDGLWITGLEDIAALSVAGQWFVVGVSAGSNTLSAIRLNPMGALFLTDIALDDLTTRFAGAVVLDTFQAVGRSFIVTGGTDDGLALFELLPGGQLFHHESIAQQTDWQIGHLTALTTAVLGAEVQVLLTGTQGETMAQMVLPLGRIGPLSRGTGQAETLSGGDTDDMLMGLAGDDRLNGGPGQDTLIAGTGQDTLSGGAGADVFVFSADGLADTIADFQPGQDRIHLDDWGMIYDPSALTIQPRSWGATLSWRDEIVHVHSANGGQLGLDSWGMDDFLF